MKFKGTIAITDPCYLGEGLPREQSRKLWDMYLRKEDMSIYGCSQSICDSTLYGDWSCHTYKGTKEEVLEKSAEWNTYYMDFFKKYNFSGLSDKEKRELLTEYNEKHSKFVKENTLGQFCADAGMVCVVYLDEILKVNPEFENWAKQCHWCATIIEDFDGDIRYITDEDDDAHIVGTGNINFYTSQSGF